MRLFRKNRSQQPQPVPQLWRNSPQPSYPDRPNRMRRVRDKLKGITENGVLLIVVVVLSIMTIISLILSERETHCGPDQHQVWFVCVQKYDPEKARE